MAASFMGACKRAPNNSTPPLSPSIGSESTSGDSTSSDSSNPEIPDSSSTGSDSSTGGDSSTGDSTGGDNTGSDNSNSDSTGGDSSGEGNLDDELPDYLYVDFTDSEKALFMQYFGEVIPFAPNDEYTVREYVRRYKDGEVETGLNFYTFVLTQEEFEAYLAKFSTPTYEFHDTFISDGSTYYSYNGNEYHVDISCRYDEEEDGYQLDVHAYTLTLGNTSGDSSTGDSSTGDSSTGGSGSVDSEIPDDSSTGGSSSVDPEIPDDSSTGGSSSVDPEIPDDSSTGGSSSVDPEIPDDSSTGGSGSSDPELPDEDPSLTILQNAYALESGASLSGTHTLTGVVTEIEKTDKGDVCLTFVVGNYTQYPMYCYWLQDADFVQVGDTITVSGTIKNYNGKIEYDKPTLVSHQGGSGGSSGGSTGGGTGNTDYTYTDFTDSQKALFIQYFGEVIPFAPNNEYEVEEYTQYYEDYDQTEIGINFYTFGNTQADFNAYREKFSSYESADSYTSDGITWYCYNGDGYYIDMTYYYDADEDGYWLDVYAYTITGGSTGDSTGGGNSGSGGTTGGNTQQPDTLMTNAGKGLPTGANGVYNVDFTKATYVKNVTEQGYYLDGCPTLSTTTKNPAVLVVPVQFSDVTAASKGYTIDNIRKAWNGSAAEVNYYSVHDYYYTSSYGKLDLDITVLNEWFTPKNNSSYYLNAKMDYSGQQIECGDQYIIDEILAYYESRMDLSQFDSDSNGTIDAIVLINTLNIDSDVTMQWAYRYWNIYTDDQGYYYEYDGVSANDYLWASYSFMHESYDANGNVSYNDSSAINTYTFIHEFGHVLGADDYYDTSYSADEGPMSGCDIMDSMLGDHNAYTKFNYGWLTTSRLVVAEGSVTLTLEDFSKNGDTIIIANNWDETLGVYQEYYIVAYYRNVDLNEGEDAGYFSRDGIVVYHVNASLYSEIYDNKTYYDVYNNNTDPSDEYGTQDNLIEYVKSTEGNFTYVVGDSISANTTDDQGNKIAYTFTVDALTDSSATITFTKNA